jgi:hypothetical protein
LYFNQFCESSQISTGSDSDNIIKLLQNNIHVTQLREKVYITPSPMGVGLHNPQPMKLPISPLELCKMGQTTPYRNFEKITVNHRKIIK